MPINADCHLHSSFSGDSETPMEDMVLQGISKGLSVMCFTEHHDLNFPDSSDGPGSSFWTQRLSARSYSACGKNTGRKSAFFSAWSWGFSRPSPGKMLSLQNPILLILLSAPPIYAAEKTRIIRIFIRKEARKRPTVNISKPFWKTSLLSRTSTPAAIWTTLPDMAPAGTNITVTINTGISWTKS